jgi:hypothetical protein
VADTILTTLPHSGTTLVLSVAGDNRARSPHAGGPHVVGDPFLLIART